MGPDNEKNIPYFCKKCKPPRFFVGRLFRKRERGVYTLLVPRH